MEKTDFQGNPIQIRCPLREEDIVYGLLLHQRVKGQGKRWFQLALAAVLTIGFLVSYGMDRTYTMGLILSGVCTLCFLVIFIMPKKIIERTAAMVAQQSKALTFSLYREGVEISDGFAKVSLSAEEVKVYDDGQYLVFEGQAERLYPLNRDCLKGLERQIVEEILMEYPGYYRFQTGGKKAETQRKQKDSL